MQNVTLSAEKQLIEKARAVAGQRHTTLNQMFRDWLLTLDTGSSRVQRHRAFMSEVARTATPGKRHFSREEMNER